MKTSEFKLVVFVFGAVGQTILDYILSNNANHLALVVVDDEQEREVFLRLGSLIGQHAVMSWREASGPEGVARLREVNPDVVLLAWWPHIIDGPLLTIARTAILNMHPSLLPHCRGKNPNFWSIVEARPFGVSIHHVTNQIDAGDIAFQEKIPVTWEDTGQTLYLKACNTMVELFKKSYSRISACDIPRVPQNISLGSFHRRQEMDDASKIDLERPYAARALLDLLRARTFAPHPGCRFADGNETFEIRIEIKRVE